MTDKQIWIHESTKVWIALGGFSYLNNKYTTASPPYTPPTFFAEFLPFVIESFIE